MVNLIPFLLYIFSESQDKKRNIKNKPQTHNAFFIRQKLAVFF